MGEIEVALGKLGRPSTAKPSLKRSNVFVLDENDNVKCRKKEDDCTGLQVSNGSHEGMSSGPQPSSSGQVIIEVAETQLDNEDEDEESLYQLNQL